MMTITIMIITLRFIQNLQNITDNKLLKEIKKQYVVQ